MKLRCQMGYHIPPKNVTGVPTISIHFSHKIWFNNEDVGRLKVASSKVNTFDVTTGHSRAPLNLGQPYMCLLVNIFYNPHRSSTSSEGSFGCFEYAAFSWVYHICHHHHFSIMFG